MKITGKRLLKIYALIGLVGLYLFIRGLNSGVRLSDTGTYIWTADQLLQGRFLYKDLFFSNLPLFPFWMAGYLKVLGGNPEAIFLSAAFEAALIASVIFIITRKEKQSYWAGMTAVAVLLFSRWSLNVSAAQNGVFAASLFMVTAYASIKGNKYVQGGILTGLALGIKGYYLSIAVGLVAGLLADKNLKGAVKMGIAAVVTLLIILTPFLLTTGKEMKADLFGYSLSRPELIKKNVITYTAESDPLLLILLAVGLVYFFKKNRSISAISWSFLIFFIVYADFRYLYLQMIWPFMGLVAAQIINDLKGNPGWQKVALLGVLILTTLNIKWYVTEVWNFEKPPDPQAILHIIAEKKPKYLYGSDQLVPLISYISRVPVLKGVADTNENLFKMGILSTKEMSKAAVDNKTILITYGLNYPEALVFEPVSMIIMDRKLYKEKCDLIESFPVFAPMNLNMISVSECGYK